jgi:hypothetical protein
MNKKTEVIMKLKKTAKEVLKPVPASDKTGIATSQLRKKLRILAETATTSL